MSRNWYESFFDGVVVDMWRAATSSERTLAEADFLERVLELAAGARVLDAPCGHGRHAVELAARGYQVTGVDLAPAMLDAARESARGRGVEIEWVESDVRNLPAGASWTGAYSMGNSFGYLGPRGDRVFLDAVAAGLPAGSRFCLHTGMVAECVLPRLEERSWAPIGDLLFLEENRYDAAASCLETVYTFVRDGRAETRTARHQVYTTRELGAMVEDAGFAVEGLFSSLDGERFELDAPELLLVARRK